MGRRPFVVEREVLRRLEAAFCDPGAQSMGQSQLTEKEKKRLRPDA